MGKNQKKLVLPAIIIITAAIVIAVVYRQMQKNSIIGNQLATNSAEEILDNPESAVNEAVQDQACGNGFCEEKESQVNCTGDCLLSNCEKSGSKCRKSCLAGEAAVGISCDSELTCCEKNSIQDNNVCVQSGTTFNDNDKLCCPGLEKISTGEDSTYACNHISSGCGQEGESFNSILRPEGYRKCCVGLVPVTDCKDYANCSRSADMICTFCGNGICGLGENSFNCSEDCAQTP